MDSAFRKNTINMSRRRTIKSIKRKCDHLWAEIIRSKNKGFCIKCSKKATEAHHIFKRTCNATRFDLSNGIPLCSHCHKFDRYGFEQDQSSKWNMGIIKDFIGNKEYNRLEKLHYELKKFEVVELLNIETALKVKLRMEVKYTKF